MKINLFKVLSFTFLWTIIVSTLVYFLLVLVFNDALTILKHSNEFTLMTLGEISGMVFFAILYMVSFFLPLFYIRRSEIGALSAPELFWRYMPLVALITSAFAGILLAIGMAAPEFPAELWINFWLVITVSYSGLIAFVYQAKKA